VRWLPLVNRAIFLRSTIVAVVIDSILTLINQPGWVVGSDPLQLLPLILVFLTPFAQSPLNSIQRKIAQATYVQCNLGCSAPGFKWICPLWVNSRRGAAP